MGRILGAVFFLQVKKHAGNATPPRLYFDKKMLPII